MKLHRLLTIGFLLCSTQAWASGVVNLGLLDINQFLKIPGSIIPQDVINEAMKTFALYTVHRPYSGATSMFSSNSMDINLEATMVKIGGGFGNAISAAGIPETSSTASMPAVPVAKVNVRRAFGESVDVGFSGLVFKGQSVLGGDIKLVLDEPEEGPAWALRLGFTHVNLPIAYIKNCNVIAPELLISKRLMFAEPYLGVGFRYIHGTLDIPLSELYPTIPDIVHDGYAFDEYVFTGVYFRLLGATGLRLGVEGSFDVSGFHTIGTVVGLGF